MRALRALPRRGAGRRRDRQEAVRRQRAGPLIRADLAESRPTTVVLAAGLALVALFLALHGANKLLLGDGSFLALDQDHNLPSWATTVLFALAGSCCGLVAWLRERSRWPFAALGAIALLLSLEQMAQVHGRVEMDLGRLASVLEVMLGLGFIAVVVLAARTVPRLPRTLLATAVLTIVVAQGSSEANSAFDLPYPLLVFFQTLEETAELLTGVLLIAATAQPLVDAIGARLRPLPHSLACESGAGD